jgi:hypothetical protein
MKNKRSKSGLAGAGWMVAVFLGVAVLFVFLDEDTEAPQATSSPATSEASVPPYHRTAESARPFPATLDPARFEIPVVSCAYEIAREIPEILAQQPCYCNCESFGHGSLLDCFASDHGAT